jgi:hypothetical protein
MMSMEKITTKDIQQGVCKWLAVLGSESICENYAHHWEMDICSMSKSGIISEFEVKISRSDFLADKKRKVTKFEHYEMRIERTSPNYFYYVCPEGLIKENEIPKWAGLYYFIDGNLKFIKGATKIHRAKANIEKTNKKMLRLTVQRKYLGGSMMTYKNKESLREYNEYQKQREQAIKQNELELI